MALKRSDAIWQRLHRELPWLAHKTHPDPIAKPDSRTIFDDFRTDSGGAKLKSHFLRGVVESFATSYVFQLIMKFSKCKKLCCLNWVASLVLTNPSDEKKCFWVSTALKLHLKIQLFQLKRLAESYSWGAVLKNKARSFKIFILLSCFISNCQVSPLKLDYWFTHLNANQSLFWFRHNSQQQQPEQ